MFIFLDTETTGLEEKDRLLQLAYKTTDVSPDINKLFNPGVPINLEAMAVHHITEKMIVDKPTFKGSQTAKKLQELLNEGILVAHNAPFDISMLEKEGITVPRYICTKKLSVFVDKEGACTSHKEQYLRYFYNIEIEATAHDAWGDILVLEKLFWILARKCNPELSSNEINIENLIDISTKPSLLVQCSFGKHKGKLWKDIDRGYLNWILKQNFDEDVIHTAKHYLYNYGG